MDPDDMRRLFERHREAELARDYDGILDTLRRRRRSASGFLRSAYLREPAFQEAALGSVVGAFEGGLVCGCSVRIALEAPQEVGADCVKQVVALEL
jgi:hypothetical protein